MTNIQNQNLSIEENNMNSTENLIQALQNHFNENPQQFTSYRKEIESLLRDHIKPMTSRSSKSGGDDWRSELKAKFGGRGKKWVFIALENIEPTLQQFEADNIDCSTYRQFTTKANKAWIRFSGPRVNNGTQCAAFEVRTEGSTIDHPKQLHYIPTNSLDSLIETMPNTPHGLKLEQDSAPKPNKPKAKPAPVVKAEAEPSELETLAEEINVELNEPPQSNDPEDWEAFLAAEGLADLDNFDDDDLDL